MQSGPKSRKKIGNTCMLLFGKQLWTDMPAVLNTTEQYRVAGLSCAENSDWQKPDLLQLVSRTGRGIGMQGQVPNEHSEGPSTTTLKPARLPLGSHWPSQRRKKLSVQCVGYLFRSCLTSLAVIGYRQRKPTFISLHTFGKWITGFHQ